jgi:hypothetical protein
VTVFETALPKRTSLLCSLGFGASQAEFSLRLLRNACYSQYEAEGALSRAFRKYSSGLAITFVKGLLVGPAPLQCYTVSKTQDVQVGQPIAH